MGAELPQFGEKMNQFIASTQSATSAQSAVEYLYDASGARIGRILNSVTNYFAIDYADGLKRPLAETDASGTVTRYYVWGGPRLLCHIEANGDTYYYHSDELGSTLALTDASGNVTDEFAYMPYGYATHTTHSGSVDTPFQWLGGYGVYFDSETDLHLTLHRAYSSILKRFIHPDPLGIDGGVNVYAMANLNPLAFIDPNGLTPQHQGNYSVFDLARFNAAAYDLKLRGGYLGGALYNAIYDSSTTLPVLWGDTGAGGVLGTLALNRNDSMFLSWDQRTFSGMSGEMTQYAAIVLGHEAGHALIGTSDPYNVSLVENALRTSFGEKPRTTYNNQSINQGRPDKSYWGDLILVNYFKDLFGESKSDESGNGNSGGQGSSSGKIGK